jgi:GNAT superfamily N-acetyltransferase
LGAGVPGVLAQQVESTIANEPRPRDLEAPWAAAEHIRQALAEHAPIDAEFRGPVFRFTDAVRFPTEVTQITAANRNLVRTTFPWLFEEVADWQPTLAVLHDGAAVSVCFSSRIGAAACAAGVETLPDFRGRGYAAAVTAAWGAAVRATGRIPLYSTSWDNHHSRSVARRLGLVMFGSETTWS